MHTEKITVRISQTGQTMEVPVYDKRAECITVVLCEGEHSVKCDLTPTRNGRAYAGSVMGREIVYECSRTPPKKDPFQKLPARTIGIAFCLLLLFVAIDSLPLIWKYLDETLHDQSRPSIREFIGGLGPVGIAFALVIFLLIFIGVAGLIIMSVLFVVSIAGLIKLCFFTKWTTPTTLQWIIFAFLLPFLLIILIAVIATIFK